MKKKRFWRELAEKELRGLFVAVKNQSAVLLKKWCILDRRIISDVSGEKKRLGSWVYVRGEGNPHAKEGRGEENDPRRGLVIVDFD